MLLFFLCSFLCRLCKDYIISDQRYIHINIMNINWFPWPSVMIVECEKMATGSNLGRCTLISDIEIRDSVWYWWEEQTSKHVCQWIYPLIVITALIDWPEFSQCEITTDIYIRKQPQIRKPNEDLTVDVIVELEFNREELTEYR